MKDRTGSPKNGLGRGTIRGAFSSLAMVGGLLAAFPAWSLEGALYRASTASMVIDGRTYPVAASARTLPRGHSLARRSLYGLTDSELSSLPRYHPRGYAAVKRVRVRTERGEIVVAKPLEVAQ